MTAVKAGSCCRAGGARRIGPTGTAPRRWPPRGILHIYQDPGEYEHALAQAEMVRPLGCVRRALDAAGCVGVEPVLADVGHGLVGGVYRPGDESGDAKTFTARLAEICAGEGVVFCYGTTVERPRADSDRVIAA